MNKLDKKFVGVIEKVKDGSLVSPDQWLVFLAKDNAFTAILPYYKNECEARGCDEVQLAMVDEMIKNVYEWRDANPGLCKNPDAKGEVRLQ